MSGSNQRTQLAAGLLAFFLGMFGAHWYYLGDTGKGNFYLIMLGMSLVGTLFLIGFLGLCLLALFCFYDFIMLLAMPAADFERQYVR